MLIGRPKIVTWFASPGETDCRDDAIVNRIRDAKCFPRRVCVPPLAGRMYAIRRGSGKNELAIRSPSMAIFRTRSCTSSSRRRAAWTFSTSSPPAYATCDAGGAQRRQRIADRSIPKL